MQMGQLRGIPPGNALLRLQVRSSWRTYQCPSTNVLAVAGAAREHLTVLIIGLGLSVALMGIAASYIARLLHRHRWIAYAGLLIILYVAVEMIYRGMGEVWPLITRS